MQSHLSEAPRPAWAPLLGTLALLLLALPAAAQPDGPGAEAPELPGLVVTAPRPADELTRPLASREADLSARARSRASDAAALLEAVPGAAVVRNGPLTGIAQLRGLSNDRVKVLVDDMQITPACANHMDPPLAYAPVEAIDALRTVAGITPVSLGGDSLAGTIVVESAPPPFAEDDGLHVSARGTASFDGSQGAVRTGGLLGAGDRKLALAYTGSWQHGDDLRFPGGRVSASGYERHDHGLLVGSRRGWGELALDLGLGITDEAGTPSLPMDIVSDESHRAGLRLRRALGGGELAARLYWHEIDHVMDNFSLRPAGAMRMRSPAESQDIGYRIDFTRPLREGHQLRVGSDLHLASFDSEIHDLTMGRRQTGIPDGKRRRVGTFAEWEASWSPRWTTLVGVRNDTVWSDAGDVRELMVPMNPLLAAALRADRDAFDARGHRRSDVDWEASALARFQASDALRLELGAARKQRAPSLLERYQWTPLAANAGLADGRLYVGNLDLEAETAWHLGLAAEWRSERLELRVAPFYTWVEDYIQGSPLADRRDPATGLPVLRYENFDDVRLYGVEASARVSLHEHLQVRGQLGYVRGRNHSSHDDLYRIAPLRGALALDLPWRALTATAELEWAARQDQVARYNDEPTTDGYGIVNLAVAWQPPGRGVRLAMGLDNLFDVSWAEHTSGLDRVTGSDVALGERLPGAGRFFHAALTATW